jgi:hypothetical protein
MEQLTSVLVEQDPTANLLPQHLLPTAPHIATVAAAPLLHHSQSTSHTTTCTMTTKRTADPAREKKITTPITGMTGVVEIRTTTVRRRGTHDAIPTMIIHHHETLAATIRTMIRLRVDVIHMMIDHLGTRGTSVRRGSVMAGEAGVGLERRARRRTSGRRRPRICLYSMRSL